MDAIKLRESHIHGAYKEVVEAYTYKGITVPAGFLTDGASIPDWLQHIFDPFDPDYATAAVIHDYLYYRRLVSKKKADKIFLEIMLKMETPRWKAYIFYYTVRLVGWITYEWEI